MMMWELDLSRLSHGVMQAVMRKVDYAQEGKREYHIAGKHGAAWIYGVDSNEELERLLAISPVYNCARYDEFLLAEMETRADILREQEKR